MIKERVSVYGQEIMKDEEVYLSRYELFTGIRTLRTVSTGAQQVSELVYYTGVIDATCQPLLPFDTVIHVM